jgi:hypothetical protein
VVRVNNDNTVELDLDNKRAPLVFVVSGRPGEPASLIGRSVFIEPGDCVALSIALSAVGEAEAVRRADAEEARAGG